MREDIPIIKEPGSRRPEQGREIQNLEREFFYGITGRRKDVIRQLRELREARGLPVFFEAILLHEAATSRYRSFHANYAPIEARKRFGKTIHELTAHEMADIFESFPDREILETEENQALSLYESSAKNGWDSRLLNVLDARLLWIDILMRQTARIRDEDARRETFAAQNNEFARLADEIDDWGRRAEYLVIWLLRRWALAKHKEHNVLVEHGLPIEDLKFGRDVVLILNGQIHTLNQKTFSSSKDRQKYNEMLIAAAAEKARNTRSTLVIVDSDNLRNLIKLENERSLFGSEKARLTRLKKDLINTLNEVVSNVGSQEILTSLVVGAAPREETESRRLTKKRLTAVLNADILKRFGVLRQEDRNDISKFLTVQRLFSEIALGVLKTEDDLRNPTEDQIQKIQQLMMH